MADIYEIRNIIQKTVSFYVAAPDDEITGTGSDVTGTEVTGTEVTGTEVTGTDIDGIETFSGSGHIILKPGQKIIVEETRINLGQIENIRGNKQISLICLT